MFLHHQHLLGEGLVAGLLAGDVVALPYPAVGELLALVVHVVPRRGPVELVILHGALEILRVVGPHPAEDDIVVVRCVIGGNILDAELDLLGVVFPSAHGIIKILLFEVPVVISVIPMDEESSPRIVIRLVVPHIDQGGVVIGPISIILGILQ